MERYCSKTDRREEVKKSEVRSDDPQSRLPSSSTCEEGTWPSLRVVVGKGLDLLSLVVRGVGLARVPVARQLNAVAHPH